MSMSISYEETGRTEQKARTRAALVEAARDLVERGTTPTVEEAAEAASVSRATAYRYFPNRQLLLVAAHPEVEVESLVGPEPTDDPAERLDQAVLGLSEILLRSERSYREMLRLSLDDREDSGELTLRKGRRYLWIEEALEPVRGRLTPEEFRRLVHGISFGVWVEALVTLVDLAGLTRERAVEVMRWSAQALLRTALEEANARELG
ncbi:MAG: TetR/AcrR family transcriptional regulator [Gemmatimonadota bacterium]|jgi:AcrR family transcriptional regulator